MNVERIEREKAEREATMARMRGGEAWAAPTQAPPPNLLAEIAALKVRVAELEAWRVSVTRHVTEVDAAAAILAMSRDKAAARQRKRRASRDKVSASRDTARPSRDKVRP